MAQDPATDCPPCEKCGVPCAVPASKLEGRSLGGNPRGLACSACGHAWIEQSVERVLQAWRAEIAWDDSQSEHDASKRKRPKFDGVAHMKRIVDELTTLRARVAAQEAALIEADGACLNRETCESCAFRAALARLNGGGA